MATASPAALVAVDVGNTKIHVGVFASLDDALPRPSTTLVIDPRARQEIEVLSQLSQHAGDCRHWRVASVNARHAALVEAYAGEHFSQAQLEQVTYVDVPLEIAVDAPERVGIDRLMAAVAAGALRKPDAGAIVICAGTAITVNLVAASGAFEGGAILPGMAMASQILQRYTDKLPWIATESLAAPPVVGKNTEAALASGIYWGTVGALRQLVERMSTSSSGLTQVFLTGGDALRLAAELPFAQHLPDLVLSGIAITARQLVGRAAAESDRQ